MGGTSTQETRDLEQAEVGERALVRIERSLSALRRRAAARHYVHEAAALATLGGALAGTLILGLRSLRGLPREQAAWGLALIPVLGLWALARVLGRTSTRAAAAARLDVATGATGLICAEAELRDPRWAPVALARIEAAADTARRADGTRPLRAPLYRAGLASGFALAALWVPLAARETAPTRRLFEQEVADLAQKLDTLEEQIDLDEATRSDLERTLERIAEELDAAQPESLYEALDRLTERLEKEAERAAEALTEARQELARSEAHAREGDAQAARAELAETLAELAEAGLFELDLTEFPELPELASLGDLGRLADASLESLELSAAELGELSSALREQLGARLAELAAAGLLKPGQLARRADELARLADLVPHVCDEECRQPGGT